MSQEIERKFLVSSDDYKQLAVCSYRIAQAYLSKDPDRTVRIRIKGDRGYITVKGRGNDSGMSRYEWEREVPVAEARELLSLCLPVIIEKTRYEVPVGTHTFEVDEFHGAHAGLVVAEVELHSEKETVALPAWLGREVTGEEPYYNAYLSSHPTTASSSH